VTGQEAPRPFGWYLTEAQVERLAVAVRLCGHRGCREPLAVYVVYYRRSALVGGRLLAYERFLCLAHGEEAARRHQVTLGPPEQGGAR
jgi:hypothetical protein